MKILKIAGIVIAALIIAVIVFAATFNVSKYKGTIEAQAKAATGRDVTFSDIKLTPSLTPAITLTDLKIANAPWGSRPEMFTARRVAVHTELIPLLFGNVKLTKVTVDDPDAWLETDKSGNGNWTFGSNTSGSSTSGGDNSNNLSLSGIDLKNLTVTYKDAQTGRAANVSVKALDVAMSGTLRDMNISKVAVDGARVAMRDGKASTDATFGKFVLDAQGKITDLGIINLALSDATLSYKSEGQPMDAAVTKLSLDRNGALVIDGKINGQAIKGTGTLAPIATLVHMNKSFPVKLSLEGMGLKADTDLNVSIQGNHPHITGTVTVPEITLAAAGSANTLAATKTPARGELFPDTPLPWSALSAADAAVTLTLGKATLPSGLVVSNVSLPISLTGGKLAMNPLTATIDTGSITGSLTMNAADKSLSLKADGKGFTAEQLAKDMHKGDMINGGPLTLSTNIHGAGLSPHAIMASASGDFLLTMGEAHMRSQSGAANPLMQIASALNPLGKGSASDTAISCAVINLPISNGIANVNNSIGIVTNQVQATAAGTINFRDEQVDLSIHPKGGGIVGGGIGQVAQVFKISGPLESPGVSLDKAAALKNLGGVVAGGAIGGGAGSALGGALGGMFGKGNSSSLLGEKKTNQATAPNGNPCEIARIGASR